MTPPLRQILRNRVKEKLARDEVVASMTVRLARGVEIARIAATCGFDTIYVDLEHSSLGLDTTGQICVAALDAGITPFVRVPANTPDYIGRALDAGALGIIAPHIRSAAEAEAVVRCVKYPPRGERSAGGPLAQYQFRDYPVPDANAAANDATMILAMMETRDALERVDEIAGVDGVDMLFIGTNDLCGELGIHGQYGHPMVRDAYARTIEAARKHGKHVGIGGLPSRPDLIAEFVAQGARYVSIGSDLSFVLAGGAEKARFVHELKR